MKTGFKELDEFYPLEKGELVAIAGRPGMGKSSLARCIVENICQNSPDEKVVILDLFERYDEWIKRVKAPKEEAWKWNLEFFEPANRLQIDINDLVTMPSVLIIDTIQMLDFGKNESSNMPNILKELKVLALQSNILIIVLTQISRKVDERAGNRPMLGDLRGVWSLDEVADKILFILRREYYDPLDRPGKAELIVAKNRTGKAGSLYLAYDKEPLSFYDWKPGPYEKEGLSAFTPEEYAVWKIESTKS